ncbi:hypothetical protein [Coraliomargarita parva]|nr:hypothetical protein [Coraliomargarita parva]
MTSRTRRCLAAVLILACLFLSACSSTSSQNGVTIKQNRSFWDYIPGL